MRKRTVGAAILVAAGILVPVLLVWWAQPDGAVEGENVRVYEIRPGGEAVPVGQPPAPADEQAPTPLPDTGPPPAPAPEPSVIAPAAPPAAEPPAGQGASVPPQPAAPPVEAAAPPAAPEPAPPPQPAPAQTPEPAAAPLPQPGDWLVQVGSFASKENALDMVGDLAAKYPVYYSQAEVGGTVYYRVRIGPYASEAEAITAADRLRAGGYQTQVQQAE